MITNRIVLAIVVVAAIAFIALGFVNDQQPSVIVSQEPGKEYVDPPKDGELPCIPGMTEEECEEYKKQVTDPNRWTEVPLSGPETRGAVVHLRNVEGSIIDIKIPDDAELAGIEFSECGFVKPLVEGYPYCAQGAILLIDQNKLRTGIDDVGVIWELGNPREITRDQLEQTFGWLYKALGNPKRATWDIYEADYVNGYMLPADESQPHVHEEVGP